MADGDVETISKRGQWVNRVIGDPEESQSFASREEAITAGRELAEHRGTEHRIVDAPPTGVITDEDEEVVERVEWHVDEGDPELEENR